MKRKATGAVVVLGLAVGLAAGGCGEPCCLTDSRPVPLLHGPAGELMVRVATAEGAEVALVDPGSPITLWNRPGEPEATRRDLRLLGPAEAGHAEPLRAFFRDAQVVESPLGLIGTEAESLFPAAVIGADLLGHFAVEIGFASRELIFWSRQSANDSFLGAAGYAVLRLPRRGGGRLEVRTPRDWLGRRSPLEVPASRLIMRACAAPDLFRREDPLPASCCAVDVPKLARGTNLSLLLSTGVGPVVLGQAAWQRVQERLGVTAVLTPRPLAVAFAAQPVPALWTSIPRLALIDREADFVNDPGPCAELARARRTEQVALLQSQNPEIARCALPCDREGRSGLAENSAAYLELEGQIEVAVIDDVTPFLQALRAEVRPQGPEVDGLIGARALGRARLEIDYFSADPRAIFSCEAYASPSGAGDTGSDVSPGMSPNVTPQVAVVGCHAVGRCPRLPNTTQSHLCFGLPPHGLPKMCENDPVSCPAE